MSKIHGWVEGDRPCVIIGYILGLGDGKLCSHHTVRSPALGRWASGPCPLAGWGSALATCPPKPANASWCGEAQQPLGMRTLWNLAGSRPTEPQGYEASLGSVQHSHTERVEYVENVARRRLDKSQEALQNGNDLRNPDSSVVPRRKRVREAWALRHTLSSSRAMPAIGEVVCPRSAGIIVERPVVDPCAGIHGPSKMPAQQEETERERENQGRECWKVLVL